MRQTFELYLEYSPEDRRFVPLTCRPGDLLGRADEILRESKALAVEVRMAGRRLFSVGGAAD